MLHEQMEIGTTQSIVNLYVVTYNSNAPSEDVKWLEDEHKACCRNPTLAKCGGEAQHLEKLEVRSLAGLPNV
jgi:hypothetical protein